MLNPPRTLDSLVLVIDTQLLLIMVHLFSFHRQLLCEGVRSYLPSPGLVLTAIATASLHAEIPILLTPDVREAEGSQRALASGVIPRVKVDAG